MCVCVCDKLLLQIELLLKRCGRKLRKLNLSTSSWFHFIEYNSSKFCDITDLRGTSLVDSLKLHCPCLQILHLENIGLTGQMLLKIGQSSGKSLQTIRLFNCFFHTNSNGKGYVFIYVLWARSHHQNEREKHNVIKGNSEG